MPLVACECVYDTLFIPHTTAVMVNVPSHPRHPDFESVVLDSLVCLKFLALSHYQLSKSDHWLYHYCRPVSMEQFFSTGRILVKYIICYFQ